MCPLNFKSWLKHWIRSVSLSVLNWKMSLLCQVQTFPTFSIVENVMCTTRQHCSADKRGYGTLGNEAQHGRSGNDS